MDNFKVDKINVLKGLEKELDDLRDVVVIGVYRNGGDPYLASSCSFGDTQDAVGTAYEAWL